MGNCYSPTPLPPLLLCSPAPQLPCFHLIVEQLKPRYSIVWTNKIAEVPQDAWNALAVPLKTPFLEWEWLNNLETSQSATAKTGWLPNHLTLWRDRTLIAMLHFISKDIVTGEFVFDHQWAELADRIGVQYYPKLLGMTPFTPLKAIDF